MLKHAASSPVNLVKGDPVHWMTLAKGDGTGTSTAASVPGPMTAQGLRVPLELSGASKGQSQVAGAEKLPYWSHQFGCCTSEM